MSVNLSEIETLVRYLIDDNLSTQNPGDLYTYTSSTIFTISEPNFVAITTVLVNDIELSSSEYSMDSTSGKITINASLVSGDTIEVRYTYYANYSSSEIYKYIRASAIHLSINRLCTFDIDSNDDIFPEPTDEEKNILAMVTSVLIEPDNATIRLPDISINMPKSLSTSDMIRKIITVYKKDSSGVFSLPDSNS